MSLAIDGASQSFPPHESVQPTHGETENRKASQWVEWGCLLLAVLCTLAAVAAHLHRTALMPSLRRTAVIWSEYEFVAAASLALVAGYYGLRSRWRISSILELPGLFIPLAALLAAGVYKLGMHQFGAWDEALIVHAASYYANGMRPFVDFPCSTPPFFMAGIRFATLVFGLKWASFAFLSAGFAVVTFCWSYLLLMSRGLARHWAMAIAFLVELSTMFLAPYWWYNNTTSIAVTLLFLSVLACLAERVAIWQWASLTVSLAMVLTAKPNVAPAILMVLVLLAVRRDRRWVAVLGCSVAAVLLAAAICYAAQMPPLDIVRSYMEVAKLRGSPIAMLPIKTMKAAERYCQVILIVSTLLMLLAALVASVRAKRFSWATHMVCAILFLVALEMVLTNSEIKPTDLCVALVAIAVLELAPKRNHEWHLGLKALMSVFLVASLYFGILHLRILAIGEKMFYEPLPTQTISGGFLDGLEAAPRLQRVLLQSQDALSRYPSETVFFGPRMDFEYAVFNRKPLPGIPLVWDTGNLYARDRIPEFFEAFHKSDPDIVILLKGKYFGLDTIALYLVTTKTYVRNGDYPDITVLMRRREIPPDSPDLVELTKVCGPGQCLGEDDVPPPTDD
jgi:hypothetical protein